MEKKMHVDFRVMKGCRKVVGTGSDMKFYFKGFSSWDETLQFLKEAWGQNWVKDHIDRYDFFHFRTIYLEDNSRERALEGIVEISLSELPQPGEVLEFKGEKLQVGGGISMLDAFLVKNHR
jgi:hypothetical protein